MNKPRTFAMLLVVVMALALQTHAQPFLTNGLVAYYEFNGNANDLSGNGNNGTLEGTVAFGVDRFGNSSNCISLPGTAGIGSGVFIPSLSNLPYSPVTYSAWYLLKNYPPVSPEGPNVMTLVGREACGDATEGALVVNSQTGYVVNTELGYETGANGYYTEMYPTTNRWAQVVLTINASNSAAIYLDGTNVTAQGAAPVGQPLSFWIGTSSSGSCGGNSRYEWNGSIDDVRIYNRALSASEVQQLYQYESQLQCAAATAVATVTNGFVVAAAVTSGGVGYGSAPTVSIEGGGGSGATATANVSNGVVTSITMTDAGTNYTNVPEIVIGSPGPPTISSQPASVTVQAYATASFSVGVVEPQAMQFQWSFDGTNIAGATLSTLTISNVVQTNLGSYAVAVTDACGTTVSSNAVLAMYPFLVTPFMGDESYWGQTNILSVSAWGSGPLSYQWYQNGVALAGDTNQTLVLSGIQFSNGGLYTVVVNNAYGSTTNTPEEVVVEPAGVSLGFSPTVTISGVTGYTYAIESTTNLANTNSWVTVTNLTLTQPVQIWVDTNVDATSPLNPKRFYQVLPGQAGP